ncbi:MAG: c-type cytochrome [Gemmatimonadota bacterium]|nr:c-type cytochrome [Gemmatimonadota bacterium]
MPLLGAVAAAGLVAWPGGPQATPDGRELVEALGCGACHAGVPGGEGIRSVAPPFGEGAPEMAPAYVYHYLADPRTVRPNIAPARMPGYDLDERQRVALALLVTNDREMRGVDDAFRSAMRRHPDADRADGRALFEALGCAGCHLHPEATARVTAPDLSVTALRVRPAWLAGYLADPVTIRPAGPEPGRGGQMPDFRLDPAEVTAIAGFLLQLGEPAVPAPAANLLRTPMRSPAAPPPWEPLSLSPFAMRKAETLLRDRWSCLGCHQLGDEGGRVGPRLDGIAERLRPEYVRALVHDPASLAPGTVMPASLEQPDRLDLVASFLLLRDAPWTGSDRVAGLREPLPPDTAPGAANYLARCAPCHGVRGDGDGFNAPFLPVPPTAHSDSAAMSLRPDDTLYDGIHAGGWILGRSHHMPAFGASLGDRETRQLVEYIRTLCRCRGPAWSRDGRGGR